MIHFSYVELIDQENKKFCFRDFSNRYIVLYFYPKDNTSGCSIQAKRYGLLNAQFKKLGCRVVGVGKGDLKSKVKFCTKYHLPQIMAIDDDFKLGKMFEVAEQKKMFNKHYWTYKRSSFLIDTKNWTILYQQVPTSVFDDALNNLNFLRKLNY